MDYSKHYYDRFSHFTRMDLDDVPLFRHISTKFRDFGAGTVLDVGCGLGYLLNWLNGLGWECVGLDGSPAALKAANELYPDLQFVAGDAYDLPFADGVFDAVLSVATIEHLDQPERSVSEMFRVLRPGGMFVVSTPEIDRLYTKLMIHDSTHVHEFTRSELEDLIAQHGTVVDVKLTQMAGRLGRTLNNMLERMLPCDILVEARKAPPV